MEQISSTRASTYERLLIALASLTRIEHSQVLPRSLKYNLSKEVLILLLLHVWSVGIGIPGHIPSNRYLNW